MTEAIGKHGSEANDDYMLQWLAANTVNSDGNHALSTADESNQGFAFHLLQLCLHALRNVQKKEDDQCPSSSRTILGDCLGTLRLWGDSFGPGELDKALDQSNELKESVLEQLVNIGKVLLQGMKNVSIDVGLRETYGTPRRIHESDP